MSLLEYGGRPLNILDFDCEARPDAYLGGDLTTRSLTAIAAGWVGEDAIESVCLVAGGHPHAEQTKHMLEWFRGLYDEADIVTGHNVVKYDLPVINGHMILHGLEPLGETMASDTLLHTPSVALSYSRSLENMADMLGVLSGKHHMSNAAWKRVNTLDTHLIDDARERVTSDVDLHKQVRAACIERGLLKPPKPWRP